MTMILDDDMPAASTSASSSMAFSPRYNACASSFSYKNQFYPGCSPGTFMGPLDIPDLRNQYLASSLDGSSSFIRKLNSSFSGTSNQMGKDYTCCGLTLSDLHALVEHFEECHVVVVDEPQPLNGLAPLPTASTSTLPRIVTQSQTQAQPPSATGSSGAGTASHSQQQQHQQHSRSIPPTPREELEVEMEDIDIDGVDDMDDMDMDGDADAAHSPSEDSGHSSPSLSPPLTPVLPFDTITTVRRNSTLPGVTSSRPHSPIPLESAFNRYSAYNEWSTMLPGAIEVSRQAPGRREDGMGGMKQRLSCVPPSLLTTPTTSRPSSPFPSAKGTSNSVPSTAPPSPSTPYTSTPSTPTSTTASSTLTYTGTAPTYPPAPKPFRCPNPKCSKSYKQSNGLKYHITHGSCSFSPNSSSAKGADGEMVGEVKPFGCQVPPCERRYKNMNGLRYHYTHSGAHGLVGMRLLEKQLAAGAGPGGEKKGELKKIKLVPQVNTQGLQGSHYSQTSGTPTSAHQSMSYV